MCTAENRTPCLTRARQALCCCATAQPKNWASYMTRPGQPASQARGAGAASVQDGLGNGSTGVCTGCGTDVSARPAQWPAPVWPDTLVAPSLRHGSAGLTLSPPVGASDLGLSLASSSRRRSGSGALGLSRPSWTGRPACAGLPESQQPAELKAPTDTASPAPHWQWCWTVLV